MLILDWIKYQTKIIRESITNGGLQNIQQIKNAIDSTGAITYTEKIANQESELAINALRELPPSKYLDVLFSLAKFSINRHH